MCKLTLSWIILGYPGLLLVVFSANIYSETVCLQETAVMNWNLTQYSNIHYAYIRRKYDLIVTIGWPTFTIIEDEFAKKFNFTVTDTWMIKMVIHNVTYADNGSYTCTVGFTSLKPEIIINEEITVKDKEDADITLSLDTDEKGCKTINCFSKHNATILGPGGKQPNGCLTNKDIGIFSCCFSHELKCFNTNCKFINVSVDANTSTHQNRHSESTTPFVTTNGELYQQNTVIIIVLGCSIPLVLLVLAVIVYRKKKCMNKGTLRDENRNGENNILNDPCPNSDYTDVCSWNSERPNLHFHDVPGNSDRPHLDFTDVPGNSKHPN